MIHQIQDILLKPKGTNMTARNFAPISIEELKAKIDAFEDNYDLQEAIEGDLKVKFGWENFDAERVPGHCVADITLMGYHQEANGFTFLGCSAGDDSDYPLFFIVYWDGTKLRAYIPTEGNLWNKKTKEAFDGSEDAGVVNEQLLKADITARILPPGVKSLPKKPKTVKEPTRRPAGKKPKIQDVVMQEINEIKLSLDRLAAFIAESIKE